MAVQVHVAVHPHSLRRGHAAFVAMNPREYW